MYQPSLQTKLIAASALIFGAALLFFLAVPAVGAASSLFGGATESAGQVVLVSDASNMSPADDYSGVEFDDANGTLFSTLATLAADYDVTDDSCGGGSPRFQIAVDTDANTVSNGNIFVYMGPSPSFTGCAGAASTGNLIGNEDAGRWDYTQLGGPLGGYSGAPANVLAGTILSINIVVDSSWSAAATGGDSEQTVNIDNVVINSNTYTFAEEAETVTVTIDKYVEGAQATALSANGASFPMQTTYSADNIGSGTDVPFEIGPVGYNSPNPYEAITAEMTSGANYAVSEVTGGEVVAESCDAEQPFALSGYTTGDTLEEAAAGTPTMTAPAFTDIMTDKYVIVWNDDCAIAPIPDSVSVTIVKYVGDEHATAENASGTTFDFIADYTFTNEAFPSGISGSDPYQIGPVGNNTANAYEAKTLEFEPGADYATHEVMNDTVGASCEEGKPFALAGYSSGESMEEAASSTPSMTAPDFMDLQSSKYVIVWNEDCSLTPEEPGMVKVTISKFINGMMASSTATSTPSFTMNATWDAENIGPGTGSYALSPVGFNSPNAYEAVTADMTAGADYMTNEVLGTNVGASCEEDKPYALGGYKTGDSLAAASSSASTMIAPAFTDIQSDKFVIVLNVTCPNGSIGGDVEGDQGTLAVTSIDAVDTSATADNTYENGWEYVFHITVPTDESGIAMKFSNWTDGTNTFATANNMRISSAQADNGGATITVTAADTYTIPDLNMITDLNLSMPGIQVEVMVEVKIPVGTPNASYTTNYGVRSQ